MSLRELAKKLDISAVFLSDVELGGRYPSKRVLTQIAHELDVKLEKLENYDTRPVEEIRRRAQADPAFGLALRKVMDRTIRSWSERNRFKEEMRTFRSKKGRAVRTYLLRRRPGCMFSWLNGPPRLSSIYASLGPSR
jgi:transcriptional regulator with XRE-family HTH domain